MVTGARLEAGATVVSGDGKRLGIVKEVAGDRFKLNRCLLPDYWLTTEYVGHVSDGLVQMVLSKTGISAARVGPPF